MTFINQKVKIPFIKIGRMERLRSHRGEMPEAEYSAAYSTGRERVLNIPEHRRHVRVESVGARHRAVLRMVDVKEIVG